VPGAGFSGSTTIGYGIHALASIRYVEFCTVTDFVSDADLLVPVSDTDTFIWYVPAWRYGDFAAAAVGRTRKQGSPDGLLIGHAAAGATTLACAPLPAPKSTVAS